MPTYLLRICMTHQSFRFPSLLSVAQTYGFDIKFISDDLTRGILLVELAGDEQAERLLDRAVLVM
jgi:tRNA (guanine10-N2)-methyltransferase